MHARNKEIQVELDAWMRKHSDAVEQLEAINVSLQARRGEDGHKRRKAVETVPVLRDYLI